MVYALVWVSLGAGKVTFESPFGLYQTELFINLYRFEAWKASFAGLNLVSLYSQIAIYPSESTETNLFCYWGG
jgi:hypothetical protein